MKSKKEILGPIIKIHFCTLLEMEHYPALLEMQITVKPV